MGEIIYQNGHGRAFLQLAESPGTAMVYQGLSAVGPFTQTTGEGSTIQGPSRRQYDEFEDVADVKGETSRPTSSMIARFGLVNPILTAKCPFHLQVHFGMCDDPQDYTAGWEKILAMTKCKFTSRSSDVNLVALDQTERSAINLTGDLTAQKLWEIDQLSIAEAADTFISKEVLGVLISDYASCGDCGYTSDGEQRIFVITKGFTTGSPGLPSELCISTDSGTNWDEYDIDSLAADEDPTAVLHIGSNIVVLSADSLSMHIAALTTPGTWSEVTTGFVAGGGPNAGYSVNSAQTWFVGNGGYIYFTSNPANGVTTQRTAGEDLNSIHGVDSRNIVAVGDNGEIVYTTNGGSTWSSVTGPTVANINCVWMRTKYQWIIGTSNGRIYYTIDGGVNWTEKNFPLTGAGEVFDIAFSDFTDSPFGALVATDATGKGFIFRTLDCGSEWYALPDISATTPANTGLKHISAGISGNMYVAGGVKTDDDGIVLVAS